MTLHRLHPPKFHDMIGKCISCLKEKGKYIKLDRLINYNNITRKYISKRFAFFLKFPAMTSFVTKINQSKLSIWIWMDLRKHSTDTCFLLLNNSKWMLQTCKSSTYTRTETKLIHQRHVQFHTKNRTPDCTNQVSYWLLMIWSACTPTWDLTNYHNLLRKHM